MGTGGLDKVSVDSQSRRRACRLVGQWCQLCVFGQPATQYDPPEPTTTAQQPRSGTSSRSRRHPSHTPRRALRVQTPPCVYPGLSQRQAPVVPMVPPRDARVTPSMLGGGRVCTRDRISFWNGRVARDVAKPIVLISGSAGSCCHTTLPPATHFSAQSAILRLGRRRRAV